MAQRTFFRVEICASLSRIRFAGEWILHAAGGRWSIVKAASLGV
jgi:hypothetical protein